MDYYSELDADLLFFDDRNLISSDNPNGFNTIKQHIGSQSYSDVAVSYAVPWQETTVTVGINNLFDKDPPFIESGFTSSTHPTTYRAFGRSWPLKWKTRF